MKRKISDFLRKDYSQFAMYDSYRKIASYCDGLKPSARKALHVVRDLNITTPMKNSNLSAKISDITEYLHAVTSLEDVVAGMNQSFAGSNNICLLTPESSFGNRTIPKAGASRYVYTGKAKITDLLFRKEDDPVLVGQVFEGKDIEPRHFIPIIPMIFVNGSEGIGNGFAQNILPRQPESVIKLIYYYLTKGTIDESLLQVWFRGYSGPVEQGWAKVKGVDKFQIKIKGKIVRRNTSMFDIVEVPVGYTLVSYRKVLDKLVDGKVIKSFHDRSEDNTFHYEIRCDREFLKQDDEVILKKMGLIVTETENYSCMGEDNKIAEFKSIEEIVKAYVALRLKYYDKRIAYQLAKYKEEAQIAHHKRYFIMSAMGKTDNPIVIFQKPKAEVIAQLEGKYMKVNDSYDYLLSLRVDTFTTEKIEQLAKQEEEILAKIKYLTETTPQNMWIQELKELAIQLKKEV